MLLALALTLLAPLPAPTDQPVKVDERVEDEVAFEALMSSYEEAYDAWRDALRAAEGLKERRAVRERDPAPIFRPRFERLADVGSGRSLVWLVKNAKKFTERKQVAGLKAEWYGRLFQSHLEAQWFGEVIAMYTKERRDVSAETIEATLAGVLEHAEGDARARVLLGLARYRLACKCSSGLDLYKQIIEEHPDSPAAEDAKKERDRLTKFGLGAAPPDFSGKTIEGKEVSLFANRGKVTVIDFWGFW